MNSSSQPPSTARREWADHRTALLTLPSLDDLTEQQVRGIACVWNMRHHPLTAATAVDLGVHEAARAGGPVSWYPRACHKCTHEAAYAELIRHAEGCADGCKDDAGGCEIGLALRRLMREHRR